jgi:hypothetical protein
MLTTRRYLQARGIVRADVSGGQGGLAQCCAVVVGLVRDRSGLS